MKCKCLCLLLTLFIHQSVAHPKQFAVASAHPLATNAGIDILSQGGNAFDAAITVASVLAVVEPHNSGLGGGSFWLLEKKDGSHVFIDAREVAPNSAHPRMYYINDTLNPLLATQSALAAGIPGTPAALCYINAEYGSLPLKKTLHPAILLAKNGFNVSKDLSEMIEVKQDVLRRDPIAANLFLEQGEPLKPGSILKQTDLARTFTLLSQKGVDGFYSGEVANALVSGVKKAGGVWAKEDLLNYRIELREPLIGDYQGTKIITAPLPSAGGIIVLNTLKALSEHDLVKSDPEIRTNLIVDSMRQAYCQARFLGDPAFTDKEEAKASPFDEKKALGNVNDEREKPQIFTRQEGGHTTHFCVIDTQGNRVSSTLTLNYPFGTGIIPKNTGVILNNEMDDFDIEATDGSANHIAPGKRPLSRMTPTIIKNRQGVGLLGTPGGRKIPAMMILALLEAQETLSPKAWVDVPRFYPTCEPRKLYFEAGAFSPSIQDSLGKNGEVLKQTQRPFGDMQAIFWDKKRNQVKAASDPRGEGLSVVLQPASKRSSR